MNNITKKLLAGIIFLVFVGNGISAQTIGNTSIGSTTYPITNIGNTNTGTSLINSGNYLVCDKYVTTIPLTATVIHTWGDVSGTVRVTIYTDNSGSPGTKLFTEVQSAVTANTLSTITIPATYLAAGTYWLAYDMSTSDCVRATTTNSPPPAISDRKFQAWTYTTTFPNNAGGWTNGAGRADCIYIDGVAIEGYAKAIKTTLSIAGTFSSVSFYSHAAGNVRLSIFSDNSGIPGTKQWESGSVAVSATAWATVTISSGTPASLILAAGTYWLAWQWNSTASGPSYSTGSSGNGNYLIQAYGSFPSTWSSGTSSSESWSIYASYTCYQAPPGVTGAEICSGNTATLGTSGAVSGNVYKWYNAASGGNLLKTSSDYLDNTYTTPVLTSTTNYWVSILGSCESTRTQVTATIDPLPSASVSGQSNINCYAGSDGTITVTASGGTGPYQYSINNGSTWQANPLFTGLAPGPYKIRVKDGKQCTSPAVP
jgi:hypothetical protein